MSIKINNTNRAKRIINNLTTILMVVIGAVIGWRLSIVLSDLNNEILNLKNTVKDLTIENESLKNKLNNRFVISELKDDLLNMKIKNMIKTAITCSLLVGAGVLMSKYGFPSVGGGSGGGSVTGTGVSIPRLNLQSLDSYSITKIFNREFWIRGQAPFTAPSHIETPPAHTEVGEFVNPIDGDMAGYGPQAGPAAQQPVEPQFSGGDNGVVTTTNGFAYQANPPHPPHTSIPRTYNPTSE